MRPTAAGIDTFNSYFYSRHYQHLRYHLNPVLLPLPRLSPSSKLLTALLSPLPSPTTLTIAYIDTFRTLPAPVPCPYSA
ncbi:hypothetical protein E2C01_037670 [Portunus trituberculatus]|uniref:Uncharacterized protein n=1 Tax=Portunus trituberculatus TaxID=210409 RepID=A0A5B7F9Y9_PORTR|nr:hypothetical protein [Portunus trituberculatus]